MKPDEHEGMECENVGEAMPDIAGIGILLGFSAQAFLSLTLSIWVIFLSGTGRLGLRRREAGSAAYEIDKRRLEMASDILMVGNDIQILTGCALIVTAFSHGHNIDLYHLHLIFDTVSFVGPSNCVALICWTYMSSIEGTERDVRKTRRSPRHRLTFLFALLFLGLAIYLGVRLDGWDVASSEPGHCYVPVGIASPRAAHPAADKAYVAVTTVWLLLGMLGTVFGRPVLRKPLVVISALQFPLHLYMMIALRVANQERLEGAEDENGWDFGQTTAMLLLVATLQDLVSRVLEFKRFDPGKEGYKVGTQVEERGSGEPKRESLTPITEDLGIEATNTGHADLEQRAGR